MIPRYTQPHCAWISLSSLIGNSRRPDMGIRTTINEHAKLTGALTAGVVVLAIGFFAWPRFRSSAQPGAQLFFSDDDGASYFIGAPNQVPPFDHHGKTAVVAVVYRCGASGRPFVAYLMKYGFDETQDGPRVVQISTPILVKRPHDSEWTATGGKTAQQGAAIMTPVCPKGESGEITLVTPSDPDNGAQSE